MPAEIRGRGIMVGRDNTGIISTGDDALNIIVTRAPGESAAAKMESARAQVQQCFCSCGNMIEFQCQICKNGICWACDVLEWQKRYSVRQQCDHPNISIPVVGFGYFKKNARHTTEWSIVGNQIVEVTRPGPGIIGPFIYVSKLLPQLTVARGELRHVCCACVVATVADAAEAIATGTMCEVPECDASAESHCACCRRAFCARDVSRPGGGGDDIMHKGLVGISTIYQAPLYIPWKCPPGLCAICAYEKANEARRQIHGICANDPDLETHPCGFWVPSTLKRTSRARRADCERVRSIVERCCAAINACIEEVAAAFPCQREQWFAEAHTYIDFNSREKSVAYVTIDEQDPVMVRKPDRRRALEEGTI